MTRRVQPVVLPLLRAALPDVTVVSVVPDVDYRTFPLLAVRRTGGTRHPDMPHLFSQPVVELTAVSAVGSIEAEELYDDALDALYAAVRDQTVVPGVGYLHSLTEAQGAAQSPIGWPDAWAVSGTVRLAVRAV